MRPAAAHLAPPLLTPAELDGLLTLAAGLPPVALVGLEQSLVPGTRGAEMALYLPARAGARAVVAGDHPTVRLDPSLAASAAWRALRAFLAANRAAAAPTLDHLWLEFGPLADPTAAHAPRLFFDPLTDAGRSPVAIVEAVARQLGRPLAGPLVHALNALHDALPPDVALFQVGLRPEVPNAGLRLCLSGVAGRDLVSFLTRIGWPGPSEQAGAAAGLLSPLVDELLVDLDLTPALQPKLGIEGRFFGPYRPWLDGRWRHLLDALVAAELADPELCLALRNWCGSTVAPAQASGGPEGALLGGRLVPGSLRGLSHVKLSLVPDRPTAARIYFGVQYRWLAPTAPLSPQPRPLPNRRPPADRLARATARALHFLAGARARDGWWEDFQLVAGPSDAWVTAYTGWSLTHVADERAVELALGAWALLKGRERAAGGWGYNRLVPCDADSTSWALLLAAALGDEGSPRAARGVTFLMAHLRPDGVATYHDESALRAYLGYAPDRPLDGWLAPAPCVTAAAANLAPLRDRLAAPLLQRQGPDGQFPAYWWVAPAHASALAVRALAALPAAHAAVDRAAGWAAGRLAPGLEAHSSFDAASYLRLLAHAPPRPDTRPLRHRAVDALLRRQEADGSWSPSARLRVPHGGERAPDQAVFTSNPGAATGVVRLDVAGIFTTATVLGALWANELSGSGASP